MSQSCSQILSVIKVLQSVKVEALKNRLNFLRKKLQTSNEKAPTHAVHSGSYCPDPLWLNLELSIASLLVGLWARPSNSARSPFTAFQICLPEERWGGAAAGRQPCFCFSTTTKEHPCFVTSFSLSPLMWKQGHRMGGVYRRSRLRDREAPERWKWGLIGQGGRLDWDLAPIALARFTSSRTTNDRQQRSWDSHGTRAPWNLSCTVFELSIHAVQDECLSSECFFSFPPTHPLATCLHFVQCT